MESEPSSQRSSVRQFLFSRWGALSLLGAFLLIIILWIYLLLGQWRPFFWNIPQLSGLFGEKNYLVLLHNENELRPTGGFITGFGIVRATGFGIETEFFGSEDVAIPSPQMSAPEPIERVLSRDEKYAGWVFRDSNFDLDFARNALRAKTFLRQDQRFQETEFDGVIALDTQVLGSLLHVLGGIELEDRVFTGENFFEQLEILAKNFDHHDREAWENRKSPLGTLAAQLLQKIQTSPTKWNEILEAMAQAANEKHLLFFFDAENLQEKFTEKGWTGTLPNEPFWSLNMANLGGRKGDRFLRKELFSSLHVQPNGLTEEQFSLYLSHEGTYNLQSDRYEAFVRIVRPLGSTLLDSSGTFETRPTQESKDYGEEISFFVVLEPGEQKLLTFDIALPEEQLFSVSEIWQLPLILQPGMLPLNWQFTLRGENDARFVAEGCVRKQARENVLFCDVFFQKDHVLAFERLPDQTPPLLQFARWRGQNQVEIRFSEDIFPEIPESGVSLLAFNAEGARIGQVYATSVTVNGENVVTAFSGPLPAETETVQIRIENLRDISGNFFQRSGLPEGVFAATLPAL